MWLSPDPLQEKYPNISTYAYCNNNPIKYIDPTGESAVVTRNIEKKTIVVSSNLIMYGEKASSEMAIKEAKTIQDNWNSAGGKVTIDDVEYSVSFVVTGSYEKSPDISGNDDHMNNYIKYVEAEHSSYVFGTNDDVAGNLGVFTSRDLEKSPTSSTHEWGHIMGAGEGPSNWIGKGGPGIMSQRGALVDPEYQYDPKALPGRSGGTVNPNTRKVTQSSIDELGLDKLNFDKGGKSTIGFTFKEDPSK